ncbi:MAG TPA: vitamin K epoxide reductase family protein [Terriglobales bacterium]|nr:vitamin K epoxide reductase family protein [Terriglobales bacterium]
MTRLARRICLAIALLAAAGILVSSLSLYHHYRKDKTAYCDLGETFNCDIVNRSSYSVVMGMPVALIGILGYLSLLALATLYRAKAETPAMLCFTSFAGLCFALYLTYIEGFVLSTWCVLCLSSLGLILAITALSSVLVAGKLRLPRGQGAL